MSAEEFSNNLKNLKLQNDIADQCLESYTKAKAIIQENLQKFGDSHNLNNLKNCSWELQYNVKGNNNLNESELSYKITFQSYDQEKEKLQNNLEFYCNAEELMHLINKLKDIERFCEKIERK